MDLGIAHAITLLVALQDGKNALTLSAAAAGLRQSHMERCRDHVVCGAYQRLTEQAVILTEMIENAASPALDAAQQWRDEAGK